MDKNSKYNTDLFQKLIDNAKKHEIEGTRSLEDLAKRVNAKKLFMSVYAYLGLMPVGEYREIEHGSISTKLELLYYFLRPFFEFSNNKLNPTDTIECLEILEKIYNSRAFSTYKFDDNENNMEINMLMNDIESYTRFVRGSAYPEQTGEEITFILGKHEKWFEKKVGIGPIKAQSLLYSIVGIIELTASELLSPIYEMDLKNENEFIPSVGNLKFKKKQKEKKIFYISKFNELILDELPVTLDKVNKIFEKFSEKEWSSLINLLGTGKEKISNIKDVAELKNLPILLINKNSCVIADLSNALDALYFSFEMIAKKDNNFYSTQLNKTKTNWVENKVKSSFSKIFPDDNIYSNVSYLDIEKGKNFTSEIDLIIDWKPFILLVEVKSKQFRLESQFGDVNKLRTDLKANLQDSFQQATRALKYIESVDATEFIEIKTGRRLYIKKVNLRKIYLISITQHHLGGLADDLNELNILGLFKDKNYPYATCIADLEVISEFCNSPDVFLHYIEKRLQLQKHDVKFHADELDYFGAYLENRLQFNHYIKVKPEKRPTNISLSGFSEIFDDYMAFKRGEKAESPDIKLKIPEEINKLLIQLREGRNIGERWIAFSLLEMSNEFLLAINQMITEVKVAKISRGMFRRVVHKEKDKIVSIVASKDLPVELLQDRTIIRGELEKYRYKANECIALGLNLGSNDNIFACASWFGNTWQYDENLEIALEHEPPWTPVNNSKLPGRNDPCICGSEKKFKNCCLSKIELNKKKMLLQKRK